MVDTLTREAAPGTWIAADGSVRVDRRRPGRRDVDSSLISLLRGQGPVLEAEAEAEPAAAVDPAARIMDRDELSPAFGIAVASTVSLLCWGWLAYALA